MTVFLKEVRNDLNLLECSNYAADGSRSKKSFKELIDFAKILIIITGSLAISFFITFLR